MNKEFQKLCTPAKIYFTLAVFSILLGLFNGIHFGMILSKLLFAFIWTFILAWLCKKGFKAVSWFLVLLPFIMIILVMIGLMKRIRAIDQLNPMQAQMQ